MKRREFLIATAMIVTPTRRVLAQQSAKKGRLAVVDPAAAPHDISIGGNPGDAIFFEEMKRLGYAEGGNLIVERYCLEGRYDRVPEIVHDLLLQSLTSSSQSGMTWFLGLCPKRTQFQSSPGQAIRLPLGSFRIWRDLVVTSQG